MIDLLTLELPLGASCRGRTAAPRIPLLAASRNRLGPLEDTLPEPGASVPDGELSANPRQFVASNAQTSGE